ncbi:unnamed protein product [Staurois parvus]|uniref:Opioid growth factor receptor (OGFr) conserved domain-containing protein n=1 Tax=Staurois parvus TaxID=386267 RepID=A0ABN9DN54_9NEOB|nr:unnamed protein product [Staurois parvus]
MGGSLSSSTSYDSTWEEDEDDDSSVVTEQPSASSTDAIYPKAQEIPRNTEKKRKEYKYMYSEAAQDMQAYRHRFQPLMSNYQDSPDEMPNLMFYKNQMECKPDGLYIEDLLEDWKDKYEILEKNHYYIQWLFPLRQPGKNPHAVPLHEDEIEVAERLI